MNLILSSFVINSQISENMGNKEKARQRRQPNKSRRKACVRKILQDQKTQKLVDNLTIDEQHRLSYCSRNNESNSTSITTSDNADNITEMKIMLIFLVSSRRVVPLNLAQTHHYLSHLYPLHHSHNCYKNRHLLIKPLKMKVQKHSKNNLIK